jgi:4-hydroxy-tetrahydrodipicolinate reductase
MVSVCFAGITGWTAPPIVAAIDEADDLTLSSGVSRSAAGQSLATAAGSASHCPVYATVAEALESAQVEVLIDYTSAAAVKNNVQTAVGAGVHAVIGSSGLTSQDYEELDRLACDQGVEGPALITDRTRYASRSQQRIEYLRLASWVAE